MLKLNIILLALCTCFMLAVHSSQSYAIECGYTQPDIVVKTERAPTEYIRNFTSAGLTQLHTGAYRPGSSNVLGLGGGPMSIELDINFEANREGSLSCLRINRIVADFIIYPAVMIAKNYQSGSCEYDAVMGHEQKHIDTFVRFQREYASKLKNHIRRVVRDYGRPKAMASVNLDFMQSEMNRSVSASVKAYLEKMQTVIKRRQLKIDNAAEYTHVAEQCSNW